MASDTLKRMEKALGQMVARPMQDVIAELEEIANADDTNPAPHLAMALVRVFFECKGGTFPGALKYLAEAERLLEAGQGNQDAEWQFSASLYRVLRNGIKLIEIGNTGPRELRESEKEELAKLALESINGIAEMEAAARRVRGSDVPKVMTAAMKTFSATSFPGTDNYRRGMRSLSGAFQSRSELRDLAGLFQYYGYRNADKFPQALRIAEALEQRHPQSAVAKKMMGSVHYCRGDYPRAARYYEEAIALSPNESFARVTYANTLMKMERFDEAREILEEAKRLDRVGDLTSIIPDIRSTIDVRESLGVGSPP